MTRAVAMGWLLASVCCSALAHLSLKAGAVQLTIPSPAREMFIAVATNRWLLIGAALHAVALALWVVGLRSIELSVAYPFIALGFVLVAFLSYLFLGEAIGVARLGGMLLIVAGVLLIARS